MASGWVCVLVVTRASCLIVCTRFFHASRSSAAICRSLQLVSSTSMRISPSCLLSNITLRVSLIWRGSSLLLFFMRIMWPTHRRRRARIHAIMLKVVVVAVASVCFDRPVICESIYALAPLIHLQASSFRSHPSDPHTKILQQAETYSRSLSLSGRFAAHMCRRVPARTFARSHFDLTSGIWSPSV